ncbi:unnamed protein product [Knipowitschia caucasica]
MAARRLCALVLLQVASVLSGEVLIFCDDPTVDRAVTHALNTFNEGIVTGHKLALFQVTFASKAENGSYWLKFTTRKSNCSASEPTPWTECDYLPIDKKPIRCNATVHMNETDTDTEHVNCQIEDLFPFGKASCLGCPEDIDENSEDLKVPLSVSISKYNSQSDHTHLFHLNEVGPATRQVVAGFRFKFKFDVRRTNCAKADHKDLHALCEDDQDKVEFANCNSTVDMAPWRQEAPNVHLNCEPGQMPPVLLRRRPPGWSPLRNMNMEQSTLAPETVSPGPAPTKAKEESSEEDLAKPSPDNSPFHCPSKTWKVFRSQDHGSSGTDATPPDAAVDSAFSDLDPVG